MRKIDKLFAIGFALSTCFVINQGYQACKAEDTENIEVMQNNNVIIWEYLKSLGYSEASRSAILANIYEESYCNPAYIQGDRTIEQFVKGAMGIGLCQWTSPVKQTELFNFATEKGKDWTDLNLQLDFLTKDVVNEDWIQGAFKDIEDFKTTDNLDKATTVFMQGYIKPTNIEVEKVKDRLDKAKEILAIYGEDIPVMGSKTEDESQVGEVKEEDQTKQAENTELEKTEETKQETKTDQQKPEEVKENNDNNKQETNEPKAEEVKNELPAIVEKVSSNVTNKLSEGVKEAEKKGESIAEMPTVYVATEENNRPQYTWGYSAIGLTALGLGYLFADQKGYIDQIEDRIMLEQYRKQCQSKRSK